MHKKTTYFGITLKCLDEKKKKFLYKKYLSISSPVPQKTKQKKNQTYIYKKKQEGKHFMA